jgi:hypothetical protein
MVEVRLLRAVCERLQRLNQASHLTVDLGQSPRASGRKLFGPKLKLRKKVVVFVGFTLSHFEPPFLGGQPQGHGPWPSSGQLRPLTMSQVLWTQDESQRMAVTIIANFIYGVWLMVKHRLQPVQV